jgi:choline dehydrogenase-like flavoprotein
MQVETSALSSGQVIETDVCVVGAGAAGISIARKLSGTSLDVCLVEGGAFEPTARSQELYRGEMATVYRDGAKDEYDRKYVTRSRLRYFGGTTNHWNGWCRPLEPQDFEKRDWVPMSGWPFGADEMAPWYEEARELVEIPAFEEDHGYGRLDGRRMVVAKDSARIATRLFHWSPPTRFGKKYREDLLAASNVRIFVESNVLRLRAAEDGGRVDRLEVQVEDGPKITIRARAIVLACGGIENARLLLLSDAEQPGGLGNQYDQVGRYFMEHPHVPRVGQVLVADDLGIGRLVDLYFAAKRDRRAGGRTMGVFVTSPETQKEEELLSFSLQLRDRKKEKLNRFGRIVAASSAGIRDLGRSADDLEPYVGRLFVRGEQVPNPDSRVTLTDETDRLGQRKVRLDWQLGEQDRHSIRRSMEIFAQEFGAAGVGKVRIIMKPTSEWPPTRGGDHHLGTTRMDADPKRGVVDANCRVHGLDNLFVAGSSVFATSGFANPTLTITALAVRLAAHLKTELIR